MEVRIEQDEVDEMMYTTTIRPLNKEPIIVETLWNSSSNCALVNNWVSKIKKIQEKKKEKPLILSLFADRSAQYKITTFHIIIINTIYQKLPLSYYKFVLIIIAYSLI